jgi:hypothetical protein
MEYTINTNNKEYEFIVEDETLYIYTNKKPPENLQHLKRLKGIVSDLSDIKNNTREWQIVAEAYDFPIEVKEFCQKIAQQ